MFGELPVENLTNYRTESTVILAHLNKYLFCKCFIFKGSSLYLNNKCDVYTNILGRNKFKISCIYAVRIISKSNNAKIGWNI